MTSTVTDPIVLTGSTREERAARIQLTGFTKPAILRLMNIKTGPKGNKKPVGPKGAEARILEHIEGELTRTFEPSELLGKVLDDIKTKVAAKVAEVAEAHKPS